MLAARTRSSLCDRRDRVRGMSSIYLLFAMTFALIGLVSFGVDLGRVRTNKAQLQTASDGAAHAGVWSIPKLDFDDARARAIAVADANNCDGDPVELRDADIEFGKFRRANRTFYPVGAVDWQGNTVVIEASNAMRVTGLRTVARGNPINLTFSRIIGRPDFDLIAPATCYIFGGPTRFGIVGIDYVRANGNTIRVDSYLPSLGTYESQTPRENGDVASNGDIDLGNGDVYGDVRPGVDGEISQGPNSEITGWQAPLDTPLNYPPATIPPGCINLGNYRPNDETLSGGSPSIKYQ
ncbi:MAG: pilus assembly protein TadG-related protein, partial [Tepidisphaeraceae bacterium]